MPRDRDCRLQVASGQGNWPCYATAYDRTGVQAVLQWYSARTGKYTDELEALSAATMMFLPAFFIAGKSDWSLIHAGARENANHLPVPDGWHAPSEDDGH